jgi:RecA/RadA recombinase
MMANFLHDVIAGIDNTNLATDGSNSSEFTGTIDTGSYILNAALSGSIYGGVPNSKITTFAGESATGKTFFVLGIMKKFLTDNPTGGVIYFDTEAAVTRDMMKSRGIDVGRVVISEPDSIESFLTAAVQMLDKYIDAQADRMSRVKTVTTPMMMVLDSLGMLSSIKELTDVAEGNDKRDMTKSQLLRGTFRVLALKLAKANVPLLVTNHTYQVIGSYVPTSEMSGGAGLKYASSSICYLTKKKDKDGKDVVGNIIRVTMHKSRFTKENKQVEVKLSYDKGLDRYYGLLDLAEKYDIIKKVATRYEMPDGSKHFGKTITEEPEKYFTEDIMRQLEIAAGVEFSYGTDEEIDSEDRNNDIETPTE